jgi:hypothetical protein
MIPFADEILTTPGWPEPLLATLYLGDLRLSIGLARLESAEGCGTFQPTDGANLDNVQDPPTTLKVKGIDDALYLANFRRVFGSTVPVYQFEVVPKSQA